MVLETVYSNQESGVNPSFTSGNGPKHKKSPSSRLLEFVECGRVCELFRTPDGTPYATAWLDGRWETWGFQNTNFALWLKKRFFEGTGMAIAEQALKDALGVLEGKARWGAGPVRDVSLRTAGDVVSIHYDLADEAGRVVEVTSGGWRVRSDAPVRFRRTKGTMPQDAPETGGSTSLLWKYVNAGSDSDRVLILAWLTAALRPTGPYAVLNMNGEQGSGKSTNSRVLRALVDPNAAPLRSEPKDQRDLAIAAHNNWLVALDNLSHVSPDLSDGVCRLATGAGFATRSLYLNDEEALFQACRPVLINGIDEVANRSDLLNRSLSITVPRIEAIKRRTEAEMWSSFEADRPRILGALFDVVSAAMCHLPTVRLIESPRMADFAVWGVAMERAMGWPDGTFLGAYEASQDVGTQAALESCPFVTPLLSILESKRGWDGTPTALYNQIRGKADVDERMQQGWPKSAGALSRGLKRIMPNLRSVGWNVQMGVKSTDHNRTRKIVITPCPISADIQGTENQDALQFAPPAEKWDDPEQYLPGHHMPDGVRCTQCGLPHIRATGHAGADHVWGRCLSCASYQMLPVTTEWVMTDDKVRPEDGSRCPFGCDDPTYPQEQTYGPHQRWWRCYCGMLWVGSAAWVPDYREDPILEPLAA